MWLYNVLDTLLGAGGGIADVGNYCGSAIAAATGAGITGGLVLATIWAGGKAKAL